MSGEPCTVAATLRRQATARAEHTLLVCDRERISYAEADRRSADLAHGLIALGAGKGTHIGLLYPNGPEFVVAMLAAARIGAVVIPFSTFATPREIREQLVHSDTAILLSARSFRTHDYVERLRDVSAGAPLLRHVVFDCDELACDADAALLNALEADVDGCDVLAIVYTSGSTSAPKGVVHTHAGLLGNQLGLNMIRGLTAADRLFCNSPFCWIGGSRSGCWPPCPPARPWCVPTPPMRA